MITQYLNDHKYSWASTTLYNEEKRLKSVEKWLDKSPQEMYEAVKDTMKPYSIKTLFIRVSHYKQWLIDEGYTTGKNEYRRFVKKNARLFKHAYQPKRLEITFDEALEKIASIDDKEVRDIAGMLLRTGLRISEIQKISEGKVLGKGGRSREFLGGHIKVDFSKSTRTLRRRLREIGLSPHDLRKLFLTRMSERGASPQDLCQMAGWSSIKTAYTYLQPKKTEELKEFVHANTGV